MIKSLDPDLDFDSEYTFYYDETNNIRKFYLKETDFNYSLKSNFLLGGVVYSGEEVNIEPLFSGLKLQNNIKEIKLKHIAFGDFSDCLKSPKLEFLLNYIINSPLYVHYSSINLLYYSIVDIVDSAILNSEAAKQLDQFFAFKLKNDFYKLCMLELEAIIEIFHKFKYPNIAKEDIKKFINALVILFSKYENTFEFHFGLTSLKQILKESEKQESLPFVMDEEDHILIKNFSQFYIRPLYTFINSFHIFDKEDYIEEIFDLHKIDNDKKLYKFRNSNEDNLIQLSDILIGLLSKMFTFFSNTSIEDIEDHIKKYNSFQIKNLDLILDLINRSDKKNRAFIHNIDSIENLKKYRGIFELRNKNYA